MDDEELLYREMDEEDPFYMGPSCEDHRWERDEHGLVKKDRYGRPIPKKKKE